MRKTKVIDGKVANVIEVDPANVPDWCADWPAAGDAAIGDDYAGGVFTKPGPNLVKLAADARAERDGLLATSDWTQVADAPVDKAAWTAYRQALRDLPAQVGFPTNIVWPTKPE